MVEKRIASDLREPVPQGRDEHAAGNGNTTRCPFLGRASRLSAMSLLTKIGGPRDLRTLSRRQLTSLASEIRGFLINRVSRTGGHLGPNLGVVELTLGIHRVFNSPHDPIIFDTGHQSYVHKILTGRPRDSSISGSGEACPATRPVPSPSTTGLRTPTPLRPCPGPRASPRDFACAGRNAPWSWWSVTGH